MLSRVLRIVSVCACSIFFIQAANAQFTVQHQAPTAIIRGEVNTLEFIVTGVTQNDVQEALLFYNYDESVGFQQQEIQFRNGSFVVDFEVDDASAAVVEYYFQLNLRSGSQVFFPENSPSENPVRVNIVSGNEEITRTEKRNQNIDYTILSPEPGEALIFDDIVIAIALFYDIAVLEPGTFELYLDNRNVTQLADTSAYFISYAPKGLTNGTYTVRLEYKTDSEKYLVEEWNFEVIDPSRARFTDLEGRPAHRPIGRIELGARNQEIGENSNDAYTARTNISGNYGLLRYSLNGFFTSQESNRLQPQNRFGANLELGKWLTFQAGHVYPNMGRFTISGRRVFGIHSKLNVLRDNFNVQFVHGELNRKVTNLYDELLIEEVQPDFNQPPVDTTYTLTYQNQGKGTFSRKITAGRVAFGNERKFQFGLQAMKVEDDTTSIFNVQDFNSLFNGPTTLRSNLTPGDINKLQENPELLEIQTGNVRPQGNFVAGADFRMGFAKNRIQLRNETMVSALNNEIYGGPLTVAGADELGFEIDQSDADLLDVLSRFIIINENMNVLPLRIKDIDSDSAEAEPFFPTSIIGSNTELSINYPKNNFKLQYRWVGPNFSSLANSTIRKDIAGYTATDRFRMFKNRLYVTLGYEALEDNVTNDKAATTESKTYRTNLSWYPVSRELPRISFGLRLRNRDNAVVRFNPNVQDEFEKASVQNFEINGIDTLLTPIPKESITFNLNGSITQQFELLEILHDASLSFNNLRTTDEVFAFGDVKSSAITLNLTSRFTDIRLRTQFGMTFNNTETGSGQTDINIFGMYAGGSYFLMDGKLNVNGRLAITSNKSKVRPLVVEPTVASDDDPTNDYFILDSTVNESTFGTFVIQAGAQYDINEYHSFIFDANFTNVSGAGNTSDSIVSLRYLFNF